MPATPENPAFLSYGFRPFFLLAGLFAIFNITIWVASVTGLLQPFFVDIPYQWHSHEMVFGYLSAVIAGFIMTAVPSWTGRRPISGLALLTFVVLWILGRIVFLIAPMGQALNAVTEGSFLLCLAAFVWREVLGGKNWRNIPIGVMISLFALANLGSHAEAALWIAPGYSGRTGIAIIAQLMALIGGRIIPAFTLNWLKNRGKSALPIMMNTLDKIVLAISALSLLLWVISPVSPITGVVLVLAGLCHLIRLGRWQGLQTRAEPLLLVLHLGYLWLATAFILMGASPLSNDQLPAATALHALTAGAFGTMTLAVMIRAILGHTGRQLRADKVTQLLFACITLSAVLRISGPFIWADYSWMLSLSAAFWCTAFGLFLMRYSTMLIRPRLN